MRQARSVRSWFRRRGNAAGSGTPPTGPANATDYDSLARVARAHLPPGMAERWLSLTRPAVRLVAARDGDNALACLGGRPLAPPDFRWPQWERHGPLSFLGELDLTALDRSGLDCSLALPTEGRLLVFYFDGSVDGGVSVVGTWDRESLAGARLVPVAADRSECVVHPTPPGAMEYDVLPLAGRQVTTYPHWEHALLRREFGESLDDRAWMEHPVVADDFMEALDELDADAPRHQVGGWAVPVQGPVEFEVAEAAMTRSFAYGDAAHTEEALAWRPLLQIDSDDAGMVWGDVGTLYWLCRPSATDGSLGRCHSLGSAADRCLVLVRWDAYAPRRGERSPLAPSSHPESPRDWFMRGVCHRDVAPSFEARSRR